MQLTVSRISGTHQKRGFMGWFVFDGAEDICFSQIRCSGTVGRRSAGAKLPPCGVPWRFCSGAAFVCIVSAGGSHPPLRCERQKSSVPDMPKMQRKRRRRGYENLFFHSPLWIWECDSPGLRISHGSVRKGVRTFFAGLRMCPLFFLPPRHGRVHRARVGLSSAYFFRLCQAIPFHSGRKSPLRWLHGLR